MFQKYTSIENSYKEKYLSRIQESVDPNTLWCVQEKVHGANFSFWIDSNHNVKIAKRSGWIGTGENFYGCWDVYARYQETMIKFFNEVSDLFNTDIKTVAVYGELCGKGVQSGVFYSEDKDFIAFDIAIKVKDKDLEFVPPQGDFEGWVDLYDMLTSLGVPVVEIEHIGTLKACIDIANDSESKVYKILGQYAPESPNIREGNVIRPYKRNYYDVHGSRILLKNKNERFSEKSAKPKKKKSPIVLNNTQKIVYKELSRYITENRVNNVISKIGEVTNKDFGKILGLTVQDAIEEFEGADGVHPKNILQDDWKDVQKLIQQDAAQVVRPVFLQVI